ncbi:hybrid sensor histidine kinase/response regulator [Limnohabitans sp.]|uniref:hybrid sensor histidine kinase/response regulator n=1 Tax=Limnohabitans sp. TaxID=1907725 RepID=UPI002FDEC4F0
MFAKLRKVFLPKSFFEGTQSKRRRSLLMFVLLWVGLCSLPFYFIPHPGYDHNANLIGAIGHWSLLLVLMLGGPYLWVAHATMVWSIAYVGFLAIMTGGINSPMMVWMTAATLPAVLLLDRVPAFFWVILVFIANLLLLFISQSGLVNSDFNTANEVMAWTVANQVFVVCLALYVVFVTERMHRIQTLEVDDSNAELERTHQALMRVHAHKDEFIAAVGHELRTPMNAILGLNGILRTELQAQPEDAAVVDHIRRSTEQLLQVVNDILDFSQLQAGKLTLHEEEFALPETVSTIVTAYEKKAQAKNIALSLQASGVQGIWVKGDQPRLKQVLNHLLDNAIKFTSEGRIVVRVQRMGGGVLFEVQDSGIGIAADRQKQIFNGFEHADVQTNRQYGGTGLGLSICERLVTLQGGTIGVSSAKGQGARFWFELPLRSVAVKEAQAAAAMARLMVENPIKILLVDDNAVNLLVARMMLKKCFPKAEVVEANQGVMALEILRQQAFDLILMDMVMPEMDGMQVTQVLRQEFSAPASLTPVLALTASANPMDHDRCLASGMDDVLHKPLAEQQLITKISNTLAARAAKAAV